MHPASCRSPHGLPRVPEVRVRPCGNATVRPPALTQSSTARCRACGTTTGRSTLAESVVRQVYLDRPRTHRQEEYAHCLMGRELAGGHDTMQLASLQVYSHSHSDYACGATGPTEHAAGLAAHCLAAGKAADAYQLPLSPLNIGAGPHRPLSARTEHALEAMCAQLFDNMMPDGCFQLDQSPAKFVGLRPASAEAVGAEAVLPSESAMSAHTGVGCGSQHAAFTRSANQQQQANDAFDGSQETPAAGSAMLYQSGSGEASSLQLSGQHFPAQSPQEEYVADYSLQRTQSCQLPVGFTRRPGPGLQRSGGSLPAHSAPGFFERRSDGLAGDASLEVLARQVSGQGPAAQPAALPRPPSRGQAAPAGQQRHPFMADLPGPTGRGGESALEQLLEGSVAPVLPAVDAPSGMIKIRCNIQDILSAAEPPPQYTGRPHPQQGHHAPANATAPMQALTANVGYGWAHHPFRVAQQQELPARPATSAASRVQCSETSYMPPPPAPGRSRLNVMTAGADAEESNLNEFARESSSSAMMSGLQPAQLSAAAPTSKTVRSAGTAAGTGGGSGGQQQGGQLVLEPATSEEQDDMERVGSNKQVAPKAPANKPSPPSTERVAGAQPTRSAGAKRTREAAAKESSHAATGEDTQAAEDENNDVADMEDGDDAEILRRRRNNREAARRSRRRKEDRITHLQQQVDQLQDENSTMSERVSSLQSTADTLTANLNALHAEHRAALAAKQALAAQLSMLRQHQAACMCALSASRPMQPTGAMQALLEDCT